MNAQKRRNTDYWFMSSLMGVLAVLGATVWLIGPMYLFRLFAI
jgi:hypothetical protein